MSYRLVGQEKKSIENLDKKMYAQTSMLHANLQFHFFQIVLQLFILINFFSRS